MRMEKKKDSPFHERSNVIAFPKPKNVSIEYTEVEICNCSLCGSDSFFLLKNNRQEIGCCHCGYIIGSHYKQNEER